jgi:hypothetical protein
MSLSAFLLFLSFAGFGAAHVVEVAHRRPRAVSSGIGFGVNCIFILFHALFHVFGGSWATSSSVGSIQFITTAPATKPSVQTRLVLQAMADGERVSQENWSRVIETLEGVSSRLKDVERVQQQIMMRTELAASVAEQAAKERNDLGRKLEETGRVVAQMRLEQLGKELGESSGGSGSPSLEVQHSGSLYTRGRHEKEVEGGRAFRGDSGRMQGEDRQSLDPH